VRALFQQEKTPHSEDAVAVRKSDEKITCLSSGTRRRRGFRFFRESSVRFVRGSETLVGSGHQGLAKMHGNSVLPKKSAKELGEEGKQENREVSCGCMLNERVIDHVKRFRVLAERCRNRKKRFDLRPSPIADICNFELAI